MDHTHVRIVLSAWIVSAASAFADIHYVSLNSTNPTPPYTNWVTAATNIQQAIDAATAGDTVLVSNGVYQTGGRITPGGTTSNRVIVDKAIAVQSVNGPTNTIIRGVLANNATAMRCVYLTNNALLAGFTLTNGGTRADGDLVLNQSGAGVLGSPGSVVSNCIIGGNWAQYGGGASRGTVVDSRLEFNFGYIQGGAAYQSTLSACEVLRNSAIFWGGGLRSGTASNCLFNGNSIEDIVGFTNRFGSAAHGSTLVHCTIISNIGPVQVANSTVINSIVYFALGTEPRRNHDASTNVTSYFTNSCTTPMPPGTDNITNHPELANFRLTETSACIDAGTNGLGGATDLDGAPRVVNDRADMGAYEFQVRFVSIASTNPVAPFVSWTTAATSIQAAVDTAFTGTVIFVSNGLYQTGGRVINGSMTNRVALDKPMSLRSMNGPDVTIIRGAKDPVTGSNGNAAVRCVYLANGASISGFTLTNGATRATGGYPTEQTGGGVFSAAGSVISNCVVAGNHAHADGGGLYSGSVFDTRIFGNTARLGGGLSQSTLNRGVVFTNRAVEGGGLYNCTAYNVILQGNQASSNAGAAELSTLYGATVYGNSANNQGGGIRNTTVGNSIILSNTAPNGPNFAYAGLSSNINHTCTTPQANGTGNITNNPLFVNAAARDFRLKLGSPCINAGNNVTAIGPSDLQRNPRVAENAVDLGAYEYDQALALFDSDGDTWSDAEEFISNTSPTNPALFFREADFAPAPEGQVALVISNTSASRRYGIYQSTNLLEAPQSWSLVSTQFPGNGATLTITLTNPAPNAALRSGVRLP